MGNDMSPDAPAPAPGQQATGGPAAPVLSGLVLVSIFTATTFLSALLLFSIQPLFAKMVLPLLGGAPSVWAVALCFFQGALLAGYLYAHALNRYAPPRMSGFVHLGVFVLATLALPIGLPAGWREPPAGDPALWQIGLFTVAVGLPFLAVAANAPLLQAWFARTGHPDARDPYFLYGASNLGSFIALLAYPFVLEPAFGLTALSRQWTIGFVLLAFAIAVCFWVLWQTADRTSGVTARDPADAATDSGAPSWMQRLGWVGLALVPSALLTAYTTHIATDVASAPLIWVLPLSLYLLTFVLIFRDKPLVFVPCALAAAAVGYVAGPWLLGLAWRDPAGLAGLLAVAAAGAAAGFGARDGGLDAMLKRLRLPSPLPTAAIAVVVMVAAAIVFYIAKSIGIAVGLSGGDADGVPSTDTMRRAGFLGAMVAAGVFGWIYRRSAMPATQWLLGFHLAAVLLALLQLSQTRHDNLFISATTGVAAFFLSGLVAHRTLYEQRPSARYLTEFYLLMSLGGVLGGLFAALAAPHLFAEVLEYPILLALTMACRPRALSVRMTDWDEWLRLWVVGALGLLAVWWTRLFDLENRIWTWSYAVTDAVPFADIGPGLGVLLRTIYSYGMAAVIALVFAAVAIGFYRYPARQLGAALVMCLAVISLPSSVKRGDAERSFFGVYRVSEADNKQYQVLTHGTTLHGAQRIRDNTGALVVDITPGTYYHPASPMARSVDLVRDRLTAEGQKGRFGVVGLGTGSLSCFSKNGERWRFFEIDPVIVGIATNPEKFSFTFNCQPQLDVVMGDARLTMAKEQNGSFDLIIVDAFSSDAIPVHLLTADAIRLYADKLTPKGVVLLHISNRYLDLDAVLAATVPMVPNLDGVIVTDDDADGSYASTTSTVGVFSRSKEALEPFRKLETATEMQPTTMRGWTDDYSDILAPFLSRLKGRR